MVVELSEISEMRSTADDTPADDGLQAPAPCGVGVSLAVVHGAANG
ncbi:hypothetical protein ACWIGW_38880 [Nocardia brasiliensis]